MISGNEYSSRLALMYMQFDLSRKAITAFAQSQDLMDAYLTMENDKFRSMMDGLADKQRFVQQIDTQDFGLLLRATDSALRTRLPRSLREVLNRINQNEYVLLIAAFESFMKDIHREALTRSPTLLRPDRSIPLGKLLSSGADEIIREEVEREVASLDRKKCEERADYFETRLGLPWPKEQLLEVICSGIGRRNTLLHENQDIEISDADVLFMRLACQVIPWFCVRKAIELYPQGFRE